MPNTTERESGRGMPDGGYEADVRRMLLAAMAEDQGGVRGTDDSAWQSALWDAMNEARSGEADRRAEYMPSSADWDRIYSEIDRSFGGYSHTGDVINREPFPVNVTSDPYNTYGLATQGYVWAAIASVTGDMGDAVQSVNGVLPDAHGNVDVGKIVSRDYSGELNYVDANLKVLSGGVEYRLVTDSDLGAVSKTLTDRIDEISGDVAGLSSMSGGWESSFSTVSSASGDWCSAFSKVSGSSADWDLTAETVSASSIHWDSVYATVLSNSGEWDNPASPEKLDSVFATVNSASGGWESAKDAVLTGSPEWDSVYATVESASSDLESARSTVELLSGGWAESETKVEESSGDWDSVYSTVQNASGGWSEAYTWTSMSGQQCVEAAAAVSESSGSWNDAASKVSESSGDWDSAHSSLKEASGGWDSVYTSVEGASGGWDSVYTSVDGASGGWNSVRSSVGAASGEWSSAYSTVHSASSDWDSAKSSADSVYASVESASSDWSSVYSTVLAESADWESAKNRKEWDDTYETVSSMSADWGGATSKVESSSAAWDRASEDAGMVYATVQSASSAWEDSANAVSETSASWDSAYSSVNASSGDWNSAKTIADSVYSSVGSASSGWESARSTVEAMSSGWDAVSSKADKSELGYDLLDTAVIASAEPYLLRDRAVNSVVMTSGFGNFMVPAKIEGKVRDFALKTKRTSLSSISLCATDASGHDVWFTDIPPVVDGSIFIFTEFGSGMFDVSYVNDDSSARELDSVFSTVDGLSADWGSAHSTVEAASGGWESVRSTVDAMSSGWDSVSSKADESSLRYDLLDTVSITSSSPYVLHDRAVNSVVITSGFANFTAPSAIDGKMRDFALRTARTSLSSITMEDTDASGREVGFTEAPGVKDGSVLFFTEVASGLFVISYVHDDSVYGYIESVYSTVEAASGAWESSAETLSSLSGWWSHAADGVASLSSELSSKASQEDVVDIVNAGHTGWTCEYENPSDPRVYIVWYTEANGWIPSLSPTGPEMAQGVSKGSLSSTELVWSPSSEWAGNGALSASRSLIYGPPCKEDVSNKVASISEQSTDEQYPSAKCMWDIIGDIESALSAINGTANGGGQS